jgi:signal transduction histidine kinase
MGAFTERHRARGAAAFAAAAGAQPSGRAAGVAVWSDSSLLQQEIERTLGGSAASPRWVSWRLTALLALAVVGFVAAALFVRELASVPRLSGDWRANAAGEPVLVGSSDAVLQPFIGRRLVALDRADSPSAPTRGTPLRAYTSTRWIPGDGQRLQAIAEHARLQRLFENPGRGTPLQLVFDDGRRVETSAAHGSVRALPATTGFLTLLALTLFVSAAVVLLSRPSPANRLYAAAALAQCVNLLFVAAEAAFVVGAPEMLARHAAASRMGLDLIAAAAGVHLAATHPSRLPPALPMAAAAWATALAIIVAMGAESLPHAWTWTQVATTLMVVVMCALYVWSFRRVPHPISGLMWRASAILAGSWALLGATVAVGTAAAPAHGGWVAVATVVWQVFFCTLLLVAPFLSQSQQRLREFALAAFAVIMAMTLDLTLVAVFALPPGMSLALALAVSALAYALTRQWLMYRWAGMHLSTAERLFEGLYRVVREAEQHPEQTTALMMRLLRDLFQPLETVAVPRESPSVRRLSDGSALIVPVPVLVDDTAARAQEEARSIVVRFAQMGQRLFNRDDAQLVERILEQMHRAVAFDHAVEQGRNEERTRIAQDLHDDIGARLLTLMYKAPTPEMEDYVRHTLQDLKTLTRGLAARQPRLSDALGEWKVDIAQRLSVVHCELGWEAAIDCDQVLSVGQWSALTRVLRELTSNVIAHSQATRADVRIALEQDILTLVVADNGVGTDPSTWSHGLGLGGVRKRIKQLGGDVHWHPNLEGGVRCEVRVRHFSQRR